MARLGLQVHGDPLGGRDLARGALLAQRDRTRESYLFLTEKEGDNIPSGRGAKKTWEDRRVHRVSKDLNAPEETPLMCLTEAIGVYALLDNRSAKPKHPVSIVITDEVHERTMYTQMIIGLARDQMAGSTGMVLFLMSATVGVEELKQSIPGAREIEIDRHENVVKRYYLERPRSNSVSPFQPIICV